MYEFEIFNGTQAGSNKGYYALNKDTGELFYAKVGDSLSSQTKTEVLASKIYNLAGIDAPELTTFRAFDGTQGLLSKYIPELEVVSEADRAVNEGFAMDAFLANWDAVCSDNTLKTPDGKVVRIDVGGTFDYRAQGAKKPFTSVVDEITTLADPSINPVSAEIFSTMTKEDLINSLKKVVDIDDNDLIELLQKEGMEQYQDVLLKRKQYLADFLQTAQDTSDEGLSTLEYLRKVKNETYKTTIDNAATTKELQEIQDSINSNVKDIETKKLLQEQLDSKKIAFESAASTTVKRQITSETTSDLLQKSCFVLDIDDNYYCNLPKGFEEVVESQYSPTVSEKIITSLKKPLTQNDVETITKLMNVCDGKYLDLFEENMLETVSFYRTLNSDPYGDSVGTFFYNFDKYTDNQWDAIMNTFKTKATGDQVSAIASYKSSSHEINNALSDKLIDSDYVINAKTQSKIDSITSYIDTQAISEPITVYRGEGYEVLGSVDIDGEKLSDLMKEAADSGDIDKINALIDKVESNNYTATQERFMSTSLYQGASFEDRPVIWELECPEGTKGACLEGLNVKAVFNNECEFLLQRDSKITITGISWDGSQWHLNGIINN